MSNEDDNYLGQEKPESRQPVFNVPGIIVSLIVILSAIHVFRMYVLSPAEDRVFLLSYAFFPIRFDEAAMARFGDAFPSTALGSFGTFVSYGFLHGDWFHLVINCFWLLVFGSAVARRFGTTRFILISIFGVCAGSLVHLLTNFGSSIPVVGASAAISAHMACAARFAFVPYGPLGSPRSEHPGAYFLPGLAIAEIFKNRQAASFLCIWFAINLFFGVGSGAIDGTASIAWEAHIGGFVAGLFLFPYLDPVENLNSP